MKKAKKTKTGKGGSRNTEGIDYQEIEKLLDFMAERGVEEFELEKPGRRIRIRREASTVSNRDRPRTEVRGGHPAFPTLPLGVPEAETETAWEGGEGPDQVAVEEDLTIVKSPIVGTFYEAPAPGAPPFVQTGTQVQVGQVLCIIEAMKLMNEIEAEIAGEIVKIFVPNGQPVEYGEPMFAIRPLKRK